MNKRRLQIKITGVVQGVGFRPFAYQLAHRYQLTGWVRNDGNGIEMNIQGESLAPFLNALQQQTPPLSQIDTLQILEIDTANENDFKILPSKIPGKHNSTITTALPADSNICTACLRELFDPTSRYYHYPFINCSHCGPRYTLTNKLPYDRAHTSMAEFKLCPACQKEYDDPANRRYHAQPIACPDCGPHLSMHAQEILSRILAGEIVAIKGVGSFHLVCDATNERTVQQLRQRKRRPAKPFAVMVANLASALQWVNCDAESAKLLESPQRPIVLLPKKNHDIAPSVAPNLSWLGLMLPHTPLHYLLFHTAANQPIGTSWLTQPQELLLIMTSANPNGEPLIIDNHQAAHALQNIADSVIDHNRTILRRCDDSVMRIINRQPMFIRRARGFAPHAIKLPYEIPSTLAIGAYLKNTICITRGNEAFVSQHLGDMNSRASLGFLEDTVDHLLTLLDVTPERVAHDFHPDFHSTRYAQTLGLPTYAIQHHHAHLAAVAAEHHISKPALGLALDGFGLGNDGRAWGGELMIINDSRYQRLGHLAHLKQPGGDIAARQPWRMAAAFLHSIGRGHDIKQRYALFPEANYIEEVLTKDLNTPTTSSCGRLFDTACGLLNIQLKSNFDGQAAMYLESLVTKPAILQGGWYTDHQTLNFTPLLQHLLTCDAQTGANLFHGTLIAALCAWLDNAAKQTGLNAVLLSGGCFLNRVLSNGLITNLTASGLTVYLPKQIPPNDGGLSLGQAWIAGRSS